MAINPISEKHAAFTLGGLFAILHAGWAAIVYAGYGPKMISWVLGLHFVQIPIQILPFNAITAIALVLATFVIGAVAGYAFAAIWNGLLKKEWAK